MIYFSHSERGVNSDDGVSTDGIETPFIHYNVTPSAF